MKRRFFSLVFCLCCALSSLECYCQASQTTCGIWFEYDATGNRIKRYYDCKSNQIPVDTGVASKATQGQAKQSQTNSRNVDQELPIEIDGLQVAPVWDDVQNTITFYPNPVADMYFLRVKLSKEVALHFHWYDSQGQIISSGSFSGSVYQGSAGNWADGIYWLWVFDKDKVVGKWKVIKISK